MTRECLSHLQRRSVAWLVAEDQRLRGTMVAEQQALVHALVAWGVDKGNVSTSLKGLEAKGLVTITRTPGGKAAAVDLTAEGRNQVIALTESCESGGGMSADQPARELLGELPKKSKRGRPRKPITQAMIAEQIGSSRRTLYRAQAHVKALERYPELETSTLAVDKQIALAKRLSVSQSSPFMAQYLLVESIAREFRALQRKLARVEQRYTEERAKLSKLVEEEA